MKYVIFGASSGLGAGIAEGLPIPGDEVWLVSRSRPKVLDLNDNVKLHWVISDLRVPSWIDNVKKSIGDNPVDLLLYSAGTWESDSDIFSISESEFYEIISVNTASFIAAATSLSCNLKLADRGWVVGIASTAALENSTGPRAAYAASKFGIRGAVHGLREVFRESGVGVCSISPGGLASDVSYSLGLQEALKVHAGSRIPMQDIVAVIRLLLSLSKATCIKEIDMPAQKDIDC